jgi:HK97 family phage major capsid protein
MNKKLEKLINKKKEQEKRLNQALIDEDDKEKRAAIGDTLRALHDEIDALMDMAEDAGEKQGEDNANDGDANGERKPDEGRSAMTGNAGAFKPLATYGAGKAEQRGIVDNDPTNTLEYRAAFRDYVATGKATMPAELRDNANTLTTDVPSVIPTVIMNRIIEGITACGMIIREVTRTAYAAGLVVPTSSVKPVATWTTEGGTTDRQKKVTGSVTFTHFKLRCEISMSAEVSAMAISAFEDAFVANVVDAMIVAIEKAIIAGTGSGQPTGILTQSVPSGQTITLADTTTHMPTYEELVAAEAALPVEYENTAKWFMTKKQFMAFVGMVDDNGQPIARVDYGIENGAVRRLLGREVIVHPYATEMGDNVAGIYDFRDYVLNTIFDLGIQRKQDWETEDMLTKAVMSVDGKPVSAASLVVMQ